VALLIKYWRPLAVLTLLLLVWLHGHKSGADNMDAKWQLIFSKQEIQAAAARQRATEAARKKEQENQAFADLIAQQGYDALREKEKENDALRNAVAARDKRLLVKVHCPAVPAAPETAQTGGVDHGAVAELAASARSDYHALRSGIIRIEAQLGACQDLLRAERR
jgi:prophage endopeptidase